MSVTVVPGSLATVAAWSGLLMILIAMAQKKKNGDGGTARTLGGSERLHLKPNSVLMGCRYGRQDISTCTF